MRFSLLCRLVWRAEEIAAKEDMVEEVPRVYTDMLAPVANTFRQCHDAVGFAEREVAAKRFEEEKVVAVFDPVYRAARWVVYAFVPTATNLPDTLKVQRTDTDVRMAVTGLVSIIESHAGTTWADELMAGRFGPCRRSRRRAAQVRAARVRARAPMWTALQQSPSISSHAPVSAASASPDGATTNAARRRRGSEPAGSSVVG